MIEEVVTVEVIDPSTNISVFRDVARRVADEAGFSQNDVWDIAGAVFEACANAAVHGLKGEPGTVTLIMRAHDDRLEAIIEDSGHGCQKPPSNGMPPASQFRGRGIPLMCQFMDEVNFDSDRGCKVTLAKRLPSAQR